MRASSRTSVPKSQPHLAPAARSMPETAKPHYKRVVMTAAAAANGTNHIAPECLLSPGINRPTCADDRY
jgi:hypothetical protein